MLLQPSEGCSVKGIAEEISRVKVGKCKPERSISPRDGQLLFDGSEHLTVAQMAVKHGLSRGLLYHRHRELGLVGEKLIEKQRIKNHGRKAKLVIIGDVAFSMKEIASICNVHPGSVSRWLREGVDIQAKMRAAA